MRVTLSDARDSPIAATVLLAGVAVAAYTVYYGSQGGTLGAPTGSPAWLLGVGAVVVAAAASIVRRWL
ncbi:hypothetical protein ACFQDG_08495 [Natronoarchaeum mannanilyticum]|uniref:Uncharacterized protein n=1 Tax=Natronoarchaeum mannanilyticum TaxID=926360 RepID=A0AAV3T7R9_9EURY